MSECRDCRQVADRLAPYVDGALPPGERDGVERHLRECEACRSVAKAEMDGRRILRDCAVRLRQGVAPAELRTRCEGLARAACASGRTPRWRTRMVPAAIAASLIVVTTAFIALLATQRSNTVLAAQLASDHTRCFGRLGPDSPALNPTDVERQLESQYGWDVHVPPPTDERMRLVEGRRCLVSHGGVPHLLYRVNGQDVSLFVFEGVTRADGDVTVAGQRTRIWSRGANSFALVSAGSSADVEHAVTYMQSEAH